MTEVSDFRAILGIEDFSRARWNNNTDIGTPTIVTYSFAEGENLPTVDEVFYEASITFAFNEAQRANFRDALTKYSDLYGLHFVEVDAGGMIDVLNVDGSPYGGWANYPNASETFTGAGEFVIDINGNYEKGSYGYQVLLHELGHALGLSHPFEGAYTLPAFLDTQSMTVMTYNNTFPSVTDIGTFDRQAIDHLYGSFQLDFDWDIGYDSDLDAVRVVASDRDEWLNGARGQNSINGQGGADTIFGREDTDTLKGSSGDDRIIGGRGEDMLYGGRQDDLVWGDLDGADPWSGAGDMIFGGRGDDTLYGEAFADELYGGGGVDRLYGGNYGDTLIGGKGGDHMWGGDYGDLVRGQTGDDTLYGDASNDTLEGELGRDELYGGTGADTLYGGSRNDTLDGGDSSDSLYSGTGADVLYGGGSNDLLDGAGGDDSLFGGDDFDTLYGGAQDDYLDGGDGFDLLYGGSGDDTLVDGANTASLYGGSGDDTLTGGAGRDYFIFDDRRGDNVITDFEDGSDRILMTAASYSFADLTITDAGGDALIDVAGIAISVRLLGVDADLIDAFDFGF